MKKISFVIALVFLIAPLSGCGKKTADKIENQAPLLSGSQEKFIEVLKKNPELAERGANKIEIAVKTREGFDLFSSILSHDKQMTVYTEVSGEGERWEYHVVYKNFSNNEERLIYSYPESSSWQTSLNSFFIKSAKAEGCEGLPFPITWTKNDRKIIFSGLSPAACFEETKSGYGYFIVAPQSGPIEALRYLSLFDEYSQAVSLRSGKKVICNSMNVYVNERAVAVDLESESEKALAADANYHYRFLGIDAATNILNLGRVKVYENKDKGCWEFVSKEEKTEVKLDEFLK